MIDNVYVKDIPNFETLSYLDHVMLKDVDKQSILKDVQFNEFSLEELGLPTAEQLLQSVLKIKDQVGLVGWRTLGKESTTYQGFSLTYNPEFADKHVSIDHQTWGSRLLTQNFSRQVNYGFHKETKNTYYDSYGFRKITPIVKKELGYFLDHLSMPVVRSRVAFLFGYGKGREVHENWHKDEPPIHVLRVNIPLQTSSEYVLDIVGEDDYGNKLNIQGKHLEVGKAYIWNTRVPHRLGFQRLCTNKEPRIHIVLGLSPWFDYNEDLDMWSKGKCFGMPLTKIINQKLFLKNEF